MRLDKFLSHAGFGSRKEVARLIKEKRITVDDKVVKDRNLKVNDNNTVTVDGNIVILEEWIYFLLNKPKGVISSTEEGPTKTVIDIIHHPQSDELFPVGRLDKDTTGFLLITNDGKLSYQLLNPKKDIFKTYKCTLKNPVSESDLVKLETGIPLKEFTTKPAKAEKISDKVVHLSISEGKFHQVKRMFRYLGNEVIELERISFGGMALNSSLNYGEYRRLTEEELEFLKKLI
ncbi:pseudouridine synthase [Phocicoccus pinnipedialis]|uniref:Pseudouridine synthase n=1 Tax=Phocicoccus pinnipedialis TaxID=110845 RepID=A0A6V7RBX5_9BACL|nr:pseudouridine synthase [Jeotgalicoccus pinnipedialis]MBP1939557.1 16S rRNA pseudouridine516 synthase [Jeotgalicoccus pinnipedialis]CAD2074957.1 Ribosomal small subunit pseudouridine synthase A [Jeotgalicoccus pinnipedialis]